MAGVARLLIAAMLLAATGAARANDSIAEAAAGGLVLRQSGDIDLVSEDLYVSAREIRVHYVFRNRADHDVRTIVAFPLPDRALGEDGESETAWPADFQTRVDGRPVEMRVERRAMLGDVDRTALLESLDVPIGGDDIVAAVETAVARLADDQRHRLESLGLIETYEEGTGSEVRRASIPRWTARETWHWEQVFPAGRDLVVEHRYTPGTGGTVLTALASAQYRQSEYGREQIARYCIDSAFLAAVERLARRAGSEMPSVDEQWLSYILVTGANWRSPIGTFRLVVDKGDPRNLVSFCGEGVRRIGPTQFEMLRTNWRPTQDLHVLILRPFPGAN